MSHDFGRFRTFLEDVDNLLNRSDPGDRLLGEGKGVGDRADQTLILSEASQQVEGGTPPAMGRPACAIVPQAVNSGRTALSLGCCGARAYLDALTPDVALYAVPGRRLAAFAERVAALARANAVLSTFHTIRRRDVEAGRSPTIRESLAAMAPKA